MGKASMHNGIPGEIKPLGGHVERLPVTRRKPVAAGQHVLPGHDAGVPAGHPDPACRDTGIQIAGTQEEGFLQREPAVKGNDRPPANLIPEAEHCLLPVSLLAVKKPAGPSRRDLINQAGCNHYAVPEERFA
jgi:hypothetical protein